MTDSDRSDDDFPDWPNIGIDTNVEGDITIESVSTDSIHLPEDPDEIDGELVGAVPIAELESLAKELTFPPEHIENDYHAGRDMAGRKLRELIQQYRGDSND